MEYIWYRNKYMTEAKREEKKRGETNRGKKIERGARGRGIKEKKRVGEIKEEKGKVRKGRKEGIKTYRMKWGKNEIDYSKNNRGEEEVNYKEREKI